MSTPPYPPFHGLTDYHLLEIAGRYWDQEIAPTLGIVPTDGFTYLRMKYVADAVGNPEAVKQLQEWASRQPDDPAQSVVVCIDCGAKQTHRVCAACFARQPDDPAHSAVET